MIFQCRQVAMGTLTLICTLACIQTNTGRAKEAKKSTIEFPSQDRLPITADTYIANDLKAPFIVLYHQAGWSRGEYLEIAPRLNQLGFNCMAVDLRSGGEVNQVINQTHRRAKEKDKSTSYLDAYPDMVSAMQYAKARYAKGSLIVWGSSYSASLVFRLSSQYPKIVNALLAFAPGEYFEKLNGKKNYIAGFAKKVTVPVFVTSAKKEKPLWQAIYAAIPSKKTFFLPTTPGNHGSRALWKQFKDHGGYWKSTTEFLLTLKKD